ncbi:MAG: hypothetical protein GWO24_11410, partial [Akkermansiaceae bacterium]|nr:hypothetical protein [Akkermansiaceae bacterium]
AHPLSRKGDPETSKKAGRETGKELPKLHAEILLALRGYFAMNTQPPTSRELGKYMNREAWRR